MMLLKIQTVCIPCKLALWKLLRYQRNKVCPNMQHVKLLYHGSYITYFNSQMLFQKTLHYTENPAKKT